jgi:hypothetical protein
MVKHFAKWAVQHDGKTYPPGAELPKEVVKALKASGTDAVIESSEIQEPKQKSTDEQG